MRKTAFALGLLAAMVAGMAWAAAGPTGPGQFYYYFDSTGRMVGYHAINCQGQHTSWGKFTRFYADGVFLCEPDH